VPKLLSESEIEVCWSDMAKWRQPKLKGRRKPPRSPGIHLSGVIRYVLQGLGELSAEDRDEVMPLRMCVGVAMEDWLVGLIGEEEPSFVWQPGELERDGVICTPDGRSDKTVIVTGSASVGVTKSVQVWEQLEEIKGATWKSRHSHGDVLREKLWMYQLAGELAMTTDELTVARLHVVWLNNNYRPPTPKYVRYLIEFERREVEDFWKNVVLANKDKVEPERGSE
jgi:hypothetical protein